MLVTEFYRQRDDGVNLYRTYSDKQMMIRQIDTGFLYDEAIDVENSGHVYEETDIPIEPIDSVDNWHDTNEEPPAVDEEPEP